MRALYVTHPQVAVEPAIAVPQWGLSALGRQRAETFAARRIVPAGALIFSSTETKAMELAELIASVSGSPIHTMQTMAENDRSATGFLPPTLFEATADRFFAEPYASIDGWERAIDAQNRIVAAVTQALDGVPASTPVVFCGHGAVGTLLKCHVARRPIDRREDQSRDGNPGGGNCFSFDLAPPRLGCEWSPMEAFSPGWFG
jgi:broad specificity phosphatase PhoE